jgi:heterodisulfide reductase subunit A-like polyferredoxin
MKVKNEARGLAALLNLGFDEDGFIAQKDLPHGVFVTGACTGPKDIERSIIQAEATSQKVYQYLMKS